MQSGDDEDDSSGRRNAVQSVGIAMKVLAALTELGTPATLSAVAQASALPPPQAHRYLQSLIAAGMARQDGATGHYDLGPQALQMGLAALARTDAFTLADQAVRSVVEETGLTVILSALGPDGPTVVRLYMGRPPVVMSVKVGSALPLLLSATGQAFLSFVPEAEVADLLARERRSVACEGVESVRSRVRAAGFARDRGRLIPGLQATAFPILDLQGRATLVAAAVSIEAAAPPDEEIAIEALARACRAVSVDLGWNDPS